MAGKYFDEAMEILRPMFEQAKREIPVKPEDVSVVIRPELLDASALSESDSKKDYRPTSFNEYIGQDIAKARIQTYLDGSKKFGDTFPHLFIASPAGCGKSTLALIIASQLNRKLVCTTGGEIKSEQQFVDKLVECDGGIIFMDECNRISKRVGFFMLPILEEFKIQGKNIKPFVMIMATTHKGDLAKDLDALIQRCLPIDLEPYKIEQLINILKIYQTKQYSNVIIPQTIYEVVANNCRYTPRIAKALLKEYVYTQDWEQVKQNNQILQNGLTLTDIKILKYLLNNSGAGKQGLANYLRVKPQTYEFDYEPFLINQELIQVANKRKITIKGKKLLENLK